MAVRSPAHERLLDEYAWGLAPGAELVWVPSRGGEVTSILPARGLSHPHFGPDPERIYLYIGVTPLPAQATSGLVSVRWDGTDRREELKVEGPGIYNQGQQGNPHVLKLAPDGRHVAFLLAHQLYVAQPIPYMQRQKLKLSKPAMPLAQLTDVGADFFSWDATGQAISWAVGDRIYHRALDSVTFDNAEDAGKGTEAVDKEAVDKEAVDKEAVDNEAVDNEPVDDKASDPPLKETHTAVSQYAVDLYRPRAQPSGRIALTNARLITMTDAGVIENGTVVVEGDRILAVGATDAVIVPEDTVRYDLGGKVVGPGFVDTHAHFRAGGQIQNKNNWSFLVNLAYGVTTGIDVQPTTVDLFAAQEMVDAGLAIGPRALSTGPGIFNNNEFKSKAHALAVLTRYKDRYRVNNLKAYISGSRQQRQWLVQAARELRLMPTTEGALDMKLDLTYAMDGFSGLEHSFPTATLHTDVVELTARTKIGYTPTLLVNYGGPAGENYFYSHFNPHQDPKLRRFTPYEFLAARTLRRDWFYDAEYVFKTMAASAYAVTQAGGQVGVGAHGQLQGLGYHWELWALASGGYTPLEALRAATLGGAEMLGIYQDVGSIAAGKLADMVVFKGDPLQDIHNTQAIDMVMKGGVLYDAATLDEKWPQQRALPEPWWWRTTPAAQLGG